MPAVLGSAGRRTALPSAVRTVPRPSRSRLAVLLAAVLAAIVALLLPAALAGPAAAAPAAPTGPAPAAAGGPAAESATAAARPPSAAAPHCVLASGAGQSPHCYATFPAAIAAATGGRVTAPGSAAAAVGDPAFTAALEDQASTFSSVVVGIEYADLNYGGASLSMTAPGRCDYSLDVDYRFASMPSGWNDRISSFRSYSNCAQQLFRGTSYTGGALTNIVSSMSYVGSAANDQASSVTFN
jgi:hypothetical protein